jgi:nucleoside-diphosphate-sugar epimerase
MTESAAMPPTRLATVFGGAGFIGRHLLPRLRQQGFEVHDAQRDASSWLDRPLGHVFYCAGLTADYAQRPHDTVQAHVSLLDRVLQQGQFESLVYLSSTRLYDGSLVDSADEDTPVALDPRQPRHLYDLSKALGESLCHAAGRGRARVARLSCVYRDVDDSDGFLAQLLRGVPPALARAEPGRAACMRVDSTFGLARDYVHLDDVLQALVLIATRGTQPLYNVASGRNLSNRALFSRVRELSGCEIVAGQCRIVRPAPRIDIQRMRREFGWRPADLLDRLADMLPQHAPC